MPEITIKHDANERVIGLGNDTAEASRQAGIALAAANDAENFASSANEDAIRAETAADVADGTRKYYATVAAGIAATTAPDTFSSDESGTLAWYDAAGNNIGEPLTRAFAGVYTRASLKAEINSTAYSATQDVIITSGFDTAEIGVGIWHRFDLGSEAANDAYVALYPTCAAKSQNGQFYRYLPSSAGVYGPAVGLVPNTGTEMTTIWNQVMDYMESRKFYKLLLPVGAMGLNAAKVFSQLHIKGEAWSGYTFNPDPTRTTTLTRNIAATCVFDLRGSSRVTFEDLDINGNGGNAANFGDGIIDTGNKGSFTYRHLKTYNCHQGWRGNASLPGSVGGHRAVIRQCNVGALNYVDSKFEQVIFSGNRQVGLKISNRQVQVLGCFVEWQRTATDGAAIGITCDVGANEVLISDTHFDRNTGYDIALLGYSGAGAKSIQIVDCKFSGAGWGNDVPAADSAAIYSQASLVSGVTVEGCTFIQRDVEAGTSEGNRAPLIALKGPITGLIWMGNNTRELEQPLNLTSVRPWVQSPTNANEYYLAPQTGKSQVWIYQPNAIEYDGTLLASGTVGSLAAGQWAWADNDSLGYSTVYVRLPGSVAPTGLTVSALYSQDPVQMTGTDIQSDAFRDKWTGTIANGGSQTVTLQTRLRVPSDGGTERVMLRVYGRSNSGNARCSYLVPLLLTRLTGLQSYVRLGALTAEISDFTVGASGAQLNITASARRLGSAVRLTLANAAGAQLNLSVELAW